MLNGIGQINKQGTIQGAEGSVRLQAHKGERIRHVLEIASNFTWYKVWGYVNNW